MKYDVLIIDDEKELADNTCDYLNMFDVKTYVCYSKEEYNEFFKENNVSLILLDINLKDGSGFDICKAARNKSDCPIIFVTALGSENSILKGYETGCDDYVVKPFSLKLLYAKSLGLLKRAKKDETSDLLSCGSISLNKRTMLVKVNDREISVNAKEYFLLLYLLENKNAVLTRRAILERVWKDDLDVTDRVVDTAIRRLRDNLGEASGQIKTVIGSGYRLTEE